ncbi:MAG: patatin family protein [Bacteroidaceae bacterium]|nr:patatin family protein [Bacteroidaceae bacterium]
MHKIGLVLEGGAMRGLFSAGVMDVMMEQGIPIDGIVGVSAGACFGCNYVTGQIGRAIRYNKQFAGDKRYCGFGSLLRTGNYYNAEFTYHIVPTQYDVFDTPTFEASPMEYHVVCTDVATGKAHYQLCQEGSHTLFEWIRASASMPLVAKMVEMNGKKYLDGGISDSIPLKFFQDKGYDKNIVILTQPEGYLKKPMPLLSVMKRKYRKFPELVKAMAQRHEMYNAQLEYVKAEERAGRCIVIRPHQSIEVGHFGISAEAMQHIYDQGREAATKVLDKLKAYCQN